MKEIDPPFRYREGRALTWNHRKSDHSNRYCPYCARFVGPGSDVPSNEEHLIGRKFVPTGFMDGDSFNFIFRSCTQCNRRKSAVEGHVSAVSLFNSPGRIEDPEVDAIAIRKASKQFHYRGERGTVVKDASIENTIEFDLAPGIKATATLVGPPQLDEAAVVELAEMQVQGFFGMVTTEDPRVQEKTRVLPLQQLATLGYYTVTDWGNAEALELARRTWAWECPLLLHSARGYFKAVLKRSKDSKEGWFWALEWNRFVRVIGGIFDPEAPPGWVVQELPDLGWQPLPDGSGRRRLETPINPQEDILFSCREDAADVPTV